MEKDAAAILQLQVTRMDFNWRWQNAASQYPNFAAHANRLMHFWTKFSEYLRELRDEPLVVRSVEVIKISQIKEGDSWSQWSDIEKIFPQFRLSALGDEWSLNGFASALDITHADGKVHVELKAGNLLAEANRKVLVLEIRAEAADVTASSAEIGNLEDRLTVANELANLAFTTMVSPEVQENVWQRTS